MAAVTRIATPPTAVGLARALPLVFDRDTRALAAALDELTAAGDERAVRTLVRLGLLQPERTTMWYQRLLNRWEAMGRPGLKPSPTEQRVVVLSDHTIDNIAPLATAFAAALGVHTDIARTEYDSVELDALNPRSAIYDDVPGFIVVVLSEHWLHRYLGHGGLVELTALERTITMLRRIAETLLEHSNAQVLVTNFAPGATPPPGGYVRAEGAVGWSSALGRLNAALDALQDNRLVVLDQAAAVHAAGGRGAYSASNYLRAKMPYEQAAAIAIAREIAAGIASLCGKGHRALVSDLDNTLWGGIIGDVGRHGVVSGQNDPDGLGYYLLQSALKQLTSLGVLVTVASKNDPSVRSVFEGNDDVALGLGDLSSIQISWEPKSRSIAAISAELGFGPEYMVFVDDNIFELAEALSQHPDLDVVHAGPEPLDTLAAIAGTRFFHSVQVTETDLDRHAQIASKQASRALESTFDDYTEYLRAIHVRVEVAAVTDENRRRVVQMLQKSNQFNLTTRHHTDADLRRLESIGATIAAFSYTDDFGPQGVVAAVILLPGPDGLEIESWVMSCRVLNRTVEDAILGWIIAEAGGRSVVGEFIETEKNGIVGDLYERLGFRRLLDGEEARSRWIFEAGDVPPVPIATLTPVS